MIKEAIEKVVRKIDLTQVETRAVFDEMMSGKATPAQIGSFLTALRMKGETVDEITGAAKAMRATSPPSCSPGSDWRATRSRPFLRGPSMRAA